MEFSLAFAGLNAAAPRQRARCSVSGRFVAWSRVPQLRLPGAPRVVVISAPVVVVADAEAASLAPVADAPPVVAGFLSKARAFGASFFARVSGAVRSVSRAAVVVGALAIGDGAPRGGGRIASDAPPVVVSRKGWTM
jgi:hypothetical protein